MRAIVLGIIGLLAASNVAMSADVDPQMQALIRLDAEIHRATQALIEDPIRARSGVEAMLKRIDADNHGMDWLKGESELSRAKRAALRGPLHNLRLALDHPDAAARALRPAAITSGPLLAAEGVDGESCARAIELVPGQALRIEVPAGESRWISVRSPQDADAPLAVNTLGSEIDAALNVYLDCREISKAAVASGDDNFGLQAIALLPPASHPLMVELHNNGERGIAVVNAVNAVSISGRITRSDTGAAVGYMMVEAFRGDSPAQSFGAGQVYTAESGHYQVTTSPASEWLEQLRSLFGETVMIC